ncbi:class I SAM-dependent methyltransferase [Maridesulfovibrio sp.]|uniref:class I SAM-dependent methyltransferase n=1 Tax=Maridesulfovibrio sp. TaxID=2795000 RepID=UPI002A188769|nr:class I SAM-dependent methyltransferase [Maridesulfovibrio sp.]
MNKNTSMLEKTVNEKQSVEHWEKKWAERWDTRETMYVGNAHLNYWQARAEDFSVGRKACDYSFGRSILSALSSRLPEQAEVLDVGCGPGSILVPMGQAGHRVTAVEPAGEMRKQLQTNAEKAGVDQYKVIPKIWQDVDTEGLKSHFDLALSAITMWMFRDLRVQLERLESVSRNLCCVVGGAGGETSGHSDGMWNSIMGDVPQPGYSEFPLAYNLLYAMGRLPEVRIVNYSTQRSAESKIHQQKLFYAKYTELTPQTEELIKQNVMSSAQDGMVHESCKASVIFWKIR